MFLRTFKSNQPFAIALMVLIGLLLWVKAFLHPPAYEFFYDRYPMPLYEITRSLLGYGVFSVIIGWILLAITGFMLVRLNTRFIFIQDRTHLPLLFFFILAGGFTLLQGFSPVMVAAIFILLALERLLGTYRVDTLSFNPFEAGFLIALACLFYANSFIFLIIVWIALILLRPGFWREWIYTILGFATPFLILLSVYYLADIGFGRFYHIVRAVFVVHQQDPVLSPAYRFYGAYILLVLIITSLFLLKVIQAKKIIARRTFNLLFWMFFVIVAGYFVIPSASYEMIIIAAIPVSYNISNFMLYTRTRKWLLDFLFVLFFILLGYALLNS
jgi:hypothetical protein